MILSPIGLMASSGMDIKSVRLISKTNKDLRDQSLCLLKGIIYNGLIKREAIMKTFSPIKDAN